MSLKKQLKFENYKICLEATKLEKNEINIDSFKNNHKEFIKTIN